MTSKLYFHQINRYDTVNVHLRSKPQWFLDMNSLGKVPTICMPNGEVFYESLPVCDFLDETFEGRKLNPTEPGQRARDKMILAHYDNATGAYYRILFSKSPDDRVGFLETFRRHMAFLESELLKRGTAFFNGDAPGMLDYMIWPWMERNEVVPMVHSDISELMPNPDFKTMVN